MRHCTVRNVMTTDPVTVTPATPLKDLVDILVGHKVSSVPVLALSGRLVGLVTENDLLRKEELHRDPNAGHSVHMTFRARRALATAETAGELMTTHPVTVPPDMNVAEAARLMDRNQVTCLPVVDGSGKMVGVVTPRDLLRVFLRPDEEIRSDIISEVLVGYLGTNPAMVQVDVADGVVKLAGEVERRSMLPFVLPMTRAVDGVIDAECELRYAVDDSKLPSAPDLTNY
jgi:CBS domain-containing protein